jgi:hypothetical protein
MVLSRLVLTSLLALVLRRWRRFQALCHSPAASLRTVYLQISTAKRMVWPEFLRLPVTLGDNVIVLSIADLFWRLVFCR